MAPPEGFDDLATAYGKPDNTFVSVMGVVMDTMAPVRTRTGDLTMTFKLLDKPLSRALTGSEGLTVRYFVKDATLLPKVKSVGDVVLLRNVKLTNFSGQRIALSNYQTGTVVFPSAGIPSPSFSIAFKDKQRLECHGIPNEVNKVNLAEQQYAVTLKAELGLAVEEREMKQTKRHSLEQSTASAQPPAKRQKTDNSFGPKFKLVKDLHHPTYADICAIVVKCYSSSSNGLCDLYVTDYTKNELVRYHHPPEEEAELEREGDAFGYSAATKKAWPGPYQQLVLKVNLKSPHAAYASKHVQEGDMVLLRNLKTRITDLGTWLEGDMWPDHDDATRVKIKKLPETNSTPEIKAMLERKAQYWLKRNAKLAASAPGDEKLSKKGKKRLKRKEKKEEKQQREEAAAAATLTTGNTTSDQESTFKAPKAGRNPHVRCSYEDVPTTSLTSILDPKNLKHTNTTPEGRTYHLPFHNAKCRARVRVVDYAPKDLADFAVPRDDFDEEHDDSRSIDSMAWQYDDAPQKYKWCFELLLEDARDSSSTTESSKNDRLWVAVPHAQAQFLLGNDMPDPGDLRHDWQMLAKLREKMFVLWGTLEETKAKGEASAKARNLPFECCIMEYGAKVDEEDGEDKGAEQASMGFCRMYAMFGTTIL